MVSCKGFVRSFSDICMVNSPSVPPLSALTNFLWVLHLWLAIATQLQPWLATQDGPKWANLSRKKGETLGSPISPIKWMSSKT